jgi:glycosyltransferase involved in cell wall biosynthesis
MLYVDYWKLHGKTLEPELIRKSDLCVANSTYLASYCRQYNRNSFYVGQGCDLEMFINKQDTPVPADMAAIKKPVIGYVGALQSIRLDIALLEHIAKTKPEWSLVLVGPEDNEFTASSLHQINNIHFLGSKPPDSLAAYINAFDVCLNPQIVNQVTIGNYPRKIDEYLAMGKPVVATRTEAMSVFEEHTYLGETKKDYVTLIEKALTEDSEEKRQARVAFAATHSWENSVNAIYEAILEVEGH